MKDVFTVTTHEGSCSKCKYGNNTITKYMSIGSGVSRLNVLVSGRHVEVNLQSVCRIRMV